MSLDVTVVNSYYPIQYVGSASIPQNTITINDFWASEEKFAPSQDWLVFDLGRVRPISFVDFEMAAKPIDFIIEWSTDNVLWNPVTLLEEFEPQLSTYYLPSESPWIYLENHFNTVTTRYVRLTFTRRADPFPFNDSAQIAFSIDVRNLRIMQVTINPEDYMQDFGTDILGNTYRTDLINYGPENVIDADPITFWQSQPNPTASAVECLYFDLRLGSTVGTMDFLEGFIQFDLNDLGMSDIENYSSDGVVVDEIFIDPVTTGPYMHIYYSMDDYPVWDEKLWIPVNRHYILKRGYFALPSSTHLKYLKLEFSNLAAAPYNVAEYPELPNITYKKYPTWVQNLYASELPDLNFINPIDRVTIDPLSLGFKRPLDLLDAGLDTRTPPAIQTTDDELKDFIQELVTQQSQPDEPQAEVESDINFYSSYMFQQDLIAQIGSDTALERYITAGETGWNSEQTPPTEPAPTVQSATDLTPAIQEKNMPIMWFPFTCRHGYQVIKGSRPRKIAYFVAIRDIQFVRRDYTISYDEAFYIENFDDTQHIRTNDFTQDDWKYVVSP